MWAILEPESDAICEIQLAQWRVLFNGPATRAGHEPGLHPGAADLRGRYVHFDQLGWVQAAERMIAAAFAADISLTAILSMDSAAAVKTLEILSRLYDCTKAERQQINYVFFSIRSIE